MGKRKQVLEAELIAALEEDVSDPEYQDEIAAWDSTAGDGIDADDCSEIINEKIY